MTHSDAEDFRDRALRAEWLLGEVLSSIGEGFTLFDDSEQLVVANEKAKDWLPEIRNMIVPGAQFETLVRAGAHSKSFPIGDEGREAWIQARLNAFREPEGPTEYEMPDGRWMLLSEARTGSGGIASLRTDISKLKAREAALLESEARYRVLTEQAIQGVLIHRDFKPLYMNNRFAEIFGYDVDELMQMQALDRLFTSDPRERAIAFGNDAGVGHDIDGHLAFSAHRRDGQVIHVEGQERALIWQGEPAIQYVLLDATARATADAHRRTMLNVISAVANAHDFKQALSSAVAAVCKNLGWAYGAAWVPTHNDSGLRLEAIWHLDTPNLRAYEDYNRHHIIDPGDGLTGAAWVEQRPQTAINQPGMKASEYGLHAGLAVPVVVDDEVLAVLAFWTEGTRYAGTELMEIIIGVAEEVSSFFLRKRSEVALQQSEARFRHLIEGSFQGVVILDDDWHPLFINRAAARIFGYVSVEQMMSREAILDGIAPQERERLIEYRRRRSQGEDAPDMYEYEGIRIDGNQLWLQCLERSLIWDGEPAMMITLLDVTAHRAAEAESKMLLEQIERTRRMESLGTLAGGVAHDINNALVPIQGLGELILDDMRDDGSKECMQTLLDSAEHIRKLTEQILAFSRSETGTLELVDLSAIVRDSLTLLGRSLPTSIGIVHRIGQDIGPVSGDPTKLVQVFMNLVTNAAHAIGSNPGQIIVTLNRHPGPPSDQEPASEGADFVRLSVIDTGPGIPEDCLERIFEPFFTTKSVGEGTGLGLSVVHGIVKAHGGQIKAVNTPGSGACFHIFLPLAQT